MVKNTSAIMLNEIREFAIDDMFAIFLIEQEKEKPYFAGKISDISKVQNDVVRPNNIEEQNKTSKLAKMYIDMIEVFNGEVRNFSLHRHRYTWPIESGKCNKIT